MHRLRWFREGKRKQHQPSWLVNLELHRVNQIVTMAVISDPAAELLYYCRALNTFSEVVEVNLANMQN